MLQQVNHAFPTSNGNATWDFAGVKKFLHDREGVSHEDLDCLEREYLRYMEIVVENKGMKLPVSPPVDQFWHTHILFSRDYLAFSNALYGDYIHHYPALTEEDRVRLAPNYAVILAKYEEKFGRPDERWWPRDCICSSCTGPGGGCDAFLS